MGESAFVCTFCSKEFSNKSRLEIHLKMHTSNKAHACSQCNRTFRTASDLKVHFRTHTGEKPYKCKFCDQAFAVSRNLTAHTRIHTGERPFVCSLCGKAFTQKSALNVHMRIHTGDKPFQCIFCAKQFAYSNSLKMHMKEHTRDSAGGDDVSSKDVCANTGVPLVTPTAPTPISSRLLGQKHSRGGRRSSRGNRRKREPFKQETLLGFSDYTQPEEEHLYTCSICSKGFDQIGVLAEHWKSHNEESDSEKSDDDEEAKLVSLNVPTTETSSAQGTIKIEAETSVGRRTRSRKNALDASSLSSEKEADTNANSSIYNNLREIIAKSLGVTQVSNGQRHLKSGNQDNSTVTFGSAAKLYQPPSLLRGYQTTKLSSDRIFGRLKNRSSMSDQDEMESPTFQSPLGVDPAVSIKTNSENIFGSLASITEKVKDVQDRADARSFPSPSLNGSFYVGNNPSQKKSCFPGDQNNSVEWEDCPNGDLSSFSYHDNGNIALGQNEEKQLTNTNPDPDFQSGYDLKPHGCTPIKQESSKSSCLIDSKLDIASLFDQDIYTSALNDALKSLPSTASTSILSSDNHDNSDVLFSNSIDTTNSQALQHETQESDCTSSSLMPSSSTMMESSSMPSIMSMMKDSQLDLLTDTSTPTKAIVPETPPPKKTPSVLQTYKCKLCSMVFCDSELFSEHLNKHSKCANPFMCTECGKQCSRQYDLKVHARTHTGERPYKCKFCNRGFAISRNLVAHLRIHTGERPYKCETCSKSFTQQSALRTHNRIHTGEKPYVCKACGKKFAYSYVLNSHLRNSKFYRCDYCEGMYAGACTMAQHMTTHEEANGKFDASLLEEKPADMDKQVSGPIERKIETPRAKRKPRKNSKKMAAVTKSKTKTNDSDLCPEPIPKLEYSDLLPNPDLSKLDEPCIKLETKEDNPVQTTNLVPDETLQIKSESTINQFPQEKYNKQFSACREELDKIFDDSVNPAPDTSLNSEQTLPNNSAQDSRASAGAGFGGKLISYLKYAKHLSQRHHAMISRKVKTRLKTYVCWYCRKGFGLLKNLNKHVTNHWKRKRKYKCQYCCRMFTKEMACFVHQKIHKSKKRFKCSWCSKGFSFACNLIVHQKFKHSLQYRLKPFKCQHCHQSFRHHPLYLSHLKLSHQKVSHKINFQNSSVESNLQSDANNGHTDDKNHLASVIKVEEGIPPISEYQTENYNKGTDLKDSENPVVTNQVKKRRAGRRKKGNPIAVEPDMVVKNKRGKKHPPVKLSDPIETVTGTDSNFSCTFCDRTFNQRHQFTVHLRIHTGEKPYRCTWCEKTFRVSNDLNVHTRIHTGYRPYHCKVCEKTFTVLRNLSTHMRVHTGEKPFECNVCAKRFSQKSALTVHQRIHTGSKPYKCDSCPQSFAHSSGLRQHKQRHNNDRFDDNEFWCTICRQAFAHYAELVVHAKTHSDESQSYDATPLNSKVKGRSNISKTAASSSLDYDGSTIKGNDNRKKAKGRAKNQSAITNNDTAIAIKMEPEAVNVMESLKFKALTNGEDDDNDDKRQPTQFPTPTLPTENVQSVLPKYQTSGSRRRKSKVSDAVTPETMVYFPPGMNLNVPATDNLKQEEQFQAAEEINNATNCFYPCDDCGKVFSQKCLLEVHSRLHKDEKPLLCKFCKKSFPTASDLKAHLFSHTNDERPYKCEVCGHGFSVSRNLTAHMRIHTGERPFRCEYCSKQFTQKSALTVHIRTHTGVKPFKCQHCDQTFAYSYSLNTHWKQQHSADADGGSKGKGGQSAAGKVFKCGECDQTFARANMLSVHRRIHKPLNTNRGRRQRYSNNPSRVTNNVLLDSTKPLEEYPPSWDKNKPHGLKREMEANVEAPENGLNNYQSQTTQYRITDRVNLRNKRPKRSRSSQNIQETHAMSEEFSKEIFESPEASHPQNLSELPEAEDGSLQGCEVCNVCGKSFSQRAHLNAHYRIHTGERPYRCHCCPKAFRVRSDLTVHVRTHTGERPYTCRFCPKAFSISRNLTAHLRTHTGERPFPCQHCSKRFTQKSALTVHLRTHTGVRPYICAQCGESFAYSHSLKVHMKHHDKATSFSQLIRGRSKKNLNSIYGKLSVNPHKIEPAETSNNIPAKKKRTSARKGARNAAIQDQQLPSSDSPTSDSNRPHPCQVCGKSFLQNSQLVAHMRIHSGVRPYLCRWCPKTFRLSSDLTVHQRVHTGEKPYKCEQCGKTFSISRNLITHMRTHTGERPFPCSCCSKRFTQKSALTVHMRTHTGATPYKCDVCQETFAYSSCLSLHRKNRKAIDCNQCGDVLLGKCAFRSHMQTHETDRTFLTVK